MKIIDQSIEVLNLPDKQKALELLEVAGRTCYKSKSTGDPSEFVKRIVDSGHHSVIEHISATFKIICDRGVSHELVRHRLCSFSQESTRYANYSKEKFGNEITVIKPFFFDEGCVEYFYWKQAMLRAEEFYLDLIRQGAKPEEARSVLPNSLKTEIVMTANLREWIHILDLRLSKRAHPQIREVAMLIQAEFAWWMPEIFNRWYEKQKTIEE